MHLATSNYRAIVSAIGQELHACYQPLNALTPELRLLLTGRSRTDCDSARRLRRPHEMWLTDDEPRRMAEISLRLLSD